MGFNHPIIMHRSRISTSFSISLALLAGACGGAGGGKLGSEPTQFPTQAALAKIAAAPVPAHLFDDKARDVPTWELSDPLPDAMEQVPHHDDTVWSKLLDDSTATRGGAVTTSEAMHCVARQQAAFVLANAAIPAAPLVDFMAARCGASTGQVGVTYQTLSGDDSIPEAKIEAQFSAPVKAMIEKALSGRSDVGIAYLRKSGHAVIALALSPRPVRVERMPLVPASGGGVVLRGEILDPVGSVRAMINRGRYGVGTCTEDLTVALPRFAFTCAALPADEAAWITVLAVPPGRILGTTVLDTLVWPAGAPTKTYAKLAQDTAPAAAGGVRVADLVAEINRVRKDAGLAPLRVAEQQSQTVARLAPHYFGGLREGGSSEVAEQVALGVRAGWEVDGLVRHGSLSSTWVYGSHSASDLVHAALAHPFSRETLLDPEAERVAIGTAGSDADPELGALFATYALFDSYHHDQDTTIVATRLAALRAAHHALPPTLVTTLSVEAQRAAKSVQDGKQTPEEALDDLLKHASEKASGRAVHAGMTETSSLDDMKFPDSMLISPTIQLGIGAGHYRHEGQPWGRFVVFYVIVDETVGPTARRAGPRAG